MDFWHCFVGFSISKDRKYTFCLLGWQISHVQYLTTAEIGCYRQKLAVCPSSWKSNLKREEKTNKSFKRTAFSFWPQPSQMTWSRTMWSPLTVHLKLYCIVPSCSIPKSLGIGDTYMFMQMKLALLPMLTTREGVYNSCRRNCGIWFAFTLPKRPYQIRCHQCSPPHTLRC